MATPVHTDFDQANPVASQAPTPYATSDLNNERSLRDLLISGWVPGFLHGSRTGTNQPTAILWSNAGAATIFRWTLTWVSGQITQIVQDWSNDSGATYGAYPAGTTTFTYDASNNITATTGNGGWMTFFIEAWVKTVKVVSDLATHMAGTGSAVHGLASMAIQAASAVAITGGLINGTAIGQTVRALLNCIRAVEDVNTYSPGANAGVVVDWSTGGGSKITANGTNAITFSGITPGVMGHVVDVSNLNAVTWPAAVDWGLGGAPSIAGRCLVNLITNDNGTKVFAAVGWRAV